MRMLAESLLAAERCWALLMSIWQKAILPFLISADPSCGLDGEPLAKYVVRFCNCACHTEVTIHSGHSMVNP